MADPELEAIRQQRLAQLQQQYKHGNVDNKQAMEEKRQEMEEMRNTILIQALDQSARARPNLMSVEMSELKLVAKDRLSMKTNVDDNILLTKVNTLCLGKPEKGKMVEDMILHMAQQGQLPGKLGERELIKLLESVNQQTQRRTVVKFDRRRAALDSDDDDL